MGCSRIYCPACGEELIHRDHRKYWESSSSLGQIMRNYGPKEIALSDIDAALWKKAYNCLRFFEHKQPNAEFGDQQCKLLRTLQNIINFAVKHDLLDARSGVYIIRGDLHGSNHGRREVDFRGPQVVSSLDGPTILTAKTHRELNDWINCDKYWTRRKGISRIEHRNAA